MASTQGKQEQNKNKQVARQLFEALDRQVLITDQNNSMANGSYSLQQMLGLLKATGLYDGFVEISVCLQDSFLLSS